MEQWYIHNVKKGVATMKKTIVAVLFFAVWLSVANAYAIEIPDPSALPSTWTQQCEDNWINGRWMSGWGKNYGASAFLKVHRNGDVIGTKKILLRFIPPSGLPSSDQITSVRLKFRVVEGTDPNHDLVLTMRVNGLYKANYQWVEGVGDGVPLYGASNWGCQIAPYLKWKSGVGGLNNRDYATPPYAYHTVGRGAIGGPYRVITLSEAGVDFVKNHIDDPGTLEFLIDANWPYATGDVVIASSEYNQYYGDPNTYYGPILEIDY
jgi:hypothetical protein